jgi:hypothetical protein
MEDDPAPKENSKIFLYGAALIGGSALILSILASPFLLVPASRKLGEIPWMTTPRTITRLALSKIPIRSRDGYTPTLIDLGSGNIRACAPRIESN